MENTIEEFSSLEDVPSSCDLPLHDQEIESTLTTEYDDLNSPSSRHSFEFPYTSETNSTADDIIFCGKIFSSRTQAGHNDDQTKIPSTKKMVIRPISYSTTFSPQQAKNFRFPSSNCSGKEHKIMFEFPNVPLKMELSDSRERQSRRTPPPIFPAVAECDEFSVVSGNGSGEKRRSWSLFRPLRYTAQDLGNMLCRFFSFGCLRLARPCID